MKKLLAIISCAALSLSLFAGCAGTTQSSQDSQSASSGSQSDSSSSASASTPAQAEYTIKLAVIPGNIAAEDSPDIMYAEVFKEQLEQGSDGRIKVDIYPSGQLGTDKETLQGVIGGNIEMTIIDLSLIGNIYEPAQALSTPGLFTSVEQCDAVINGPWGEEFCAAVEESANVKILNMNSKGFRCFTNNVRELRVPEDAKGIKFRVMENPVSIKMVEALGAIATPMAGSEMYTAMQNGIVDGQENPPINIVQDKTYEVQKYAILDEHMAGIMAYVMSEQFYNGLPDDLKAAVDEAAAAALVEAQKVITNKTADSVQKMKDEGMTVYEPTAEEKAQWHDVMYSACESYVREMVGDEVMDGLIAAVDAAS